MKVWDFIGRWIGRILLSPFALIFLASLLICASTEWAWNAIEELDKP